MGTRDFSVRVKLPGREADHSPPSSAKVKNTWSYTFTPQYAYMALCSVKKIGMKLHNEDVREKRNAYRILVEQHEVKKTI
jgi:hypothetical protein